MAREHYRTKGIVLSQRDLAEADRVFCLYTRDFGKIEVVARSLRKITSKLRSGIGPFYFSEIEFIQGKTHKTLIDAIILDKFSNIQKNENSLEIIAKIAQIVCCLTPNQEQDKKIWQLLFETIKKINILSFENLKIENSLKIVNCKLKIIIFYYFLWNFFKLLGYLPELYNCCACHQKLLPQTLFFAPQSGGVICWECLVKLKKENQNYQVSEITVEAIKLMRFFLSETLEKAQRLNVWEKDLKNLEQISNIYFRFLTENCGVDIT